jgi:branched-chain amino acid aminotransferase
MGQRFAYFKKKIVPLEEAKIGIMTHAFNYGTRASRASAAIGAPEGRSPLPRAGHFQRLRNPARSSASTSLRRRRADGPHCAAGRAVRVRGGHHVRPLAYKSSEMVGVRMHNLEDDFLIFVTPFGPYLDIEKGARCCTSTWRRVDDLGIPARAKVTGIYVNSALAKTEAEKNGFDEAIVLTHDGHVSEGSGENIFLIAGGRLITPAQSDNILVGITARPRSRWPATSWGWRRWSATSTGRSCTPPTSAMTGTAAHITPVVELTTGR